MRTIWKVELAISDRQVIILPKGSTILTTQMQRGIPCLWAIVDPTELQEERHICVIGTGHEIEDSKILSYIGTCQQFYGELIWHIFEIKKE